MSIKNGVISFNQQCNNSFISKYFKKNVWLKYVFLNQTFLYIYGHKMNIYEVFLQGELWHGQPYYFWYKCGTYTRDKSNYMFHQFVAQKGNFLNGLQPEWWF